MKTLDSFVNGDVNSAEQPDRVGRQDPVDAL